MNEKPKTLDLTFLKDFCNNDKKKMTRYIHTFLESVPEQLQVIKNAAASGQWQDIKSAAHSLKPQVAFIGLPVAQFWIEKIEEQAIPNFSERYIRELTVELNQAMEDASDALIQALLTIS
jgi:HPt (histidine-containing phosphotransfer) domain-containing protein